MREYEIELVCTCNSCPEQYDAIDAGENRIAYLRLRYGHFTVECPDAGGRLIYQSETISEGVFIDSEREHYLNAAKKAIAAYYSEKEQEELEEEYYYADYYDDIEF